MLIQYKFQAARDIVMIYKDKSKLSNRDFVQNVKRILRDFNSQSVSQLRQEDIDDFIQQIENLITPYKIEL